MVPMEIRLNAFRRLTIPQKQFIIITIIIISSSIKSRGPRKESVAAKRAVTQSEKTLLNTSEARLYRINFFVGFPLASEEPFPGAPLKTHYQSILTSLCL